MTKRSAKKIILLAALLVVAAFAAFVFTACGDDNQEVILYEYFSFTYDSGKGGLIVSVPEGKGYKLPADVVIPENYYDKGDTSFSTPYKVVGVDSNGFAGCTNITSVSLPGTVTYIGDSAFEGCSGLKSINLDDIGSIGSNAFRNCKELSSVTLSSESLKAIGGGAFAGCKVLKTVSGSAKIETIGAEAFKSCVALMSVDLDISSLNSIGAQAFFYTGSLNELEYPSSCKVASDAFEGSRAS